MKDGETTDRRVQIETERIFYVHSKILNNIIIGSRRDWIAEQMELADISFRCDFDHCRILLTGLKREYYLACEESDDSYFSAEYLIKDDVKRYAENYGVDYHLFYHYITKEIFIIFSPRRGTGNAELERFAERVHEAVKYHLTHRMPEITERCAVMTVVTGNACRYEEIASAVCRLQRIKEKEFFTLHHAICFLSVEEETDSDEQEIMNWLEMLYDMLSRREIEAARDALSKIYLQHLRSRGCLRSTDEWISALRLLLHRWISGFGIHPQEIDLDSVLRLRACNIMEAHRNADACLCRCAERIADRNHIRLPVIREAVLYIGLHEREHITLDSLSHVLGVNPAYLSRCFSEQMGVPFSRYINERKVEKAKRILAGSRKSMKLVAEEAGFTSVNRFYRVFGQVTGITPSAFRARNLKSK